MITNSKRAIKEMWKTERAFLVVLTLFTVPLYYINVNYNLTLEIPSGSLQVIGLFIAFFLVFMGQKSYERWWEARMIWGDIVNKSRSWAMQVNHLMSEKVDFKLDGQNLDDFKKSLILRQIGFVNALRLHLRRQNDWEQIKPFFTESEFLDLLEKANVPTHILDLQAYELKRAIPGGTEGVLIQAELNTVLKDLYDGQGKSERIKNTVFPRPYTFFARLIVYVYIFILPIYLIREFLHGGITDLDFVAIPLVLFICFVFYSLIRLAGQYENPFENTVHDIPLTAICNTIEIDLRELVGDKAPQKLKADDEGVIF